MARKSKAIFVRTSDIGDMSGVGGGWLAGWGALRLVFSKMRRNLQRDVGEVRERSSSGSATNRIVPQRSSFRSPTFVLFAFGERKKGFAVDARAGGRRVS